jgi:putative transposase
VRQAPTQPLPLTGKDVGIEVGLKVFLTITAEGEIAENPRHYRQAARRLAKAQRRVARRKKGSKRCRTAVHLLKRTHQQVRRQRRAFPHQTALALVRGYDVLSLEDVQGRTLSRRPEPQPDDDGALALTGPARRLA